MDYNGFTDEELVELSRCAENASAPMETLLNRYRHSIKSVARSYFLSSGDSDDLVQEGMIGFFKAITSYEKGRSMFSTYAFTCIKNCILTAIKSSNANKNNPLKNYVSISNLNDNGEDKGIVISDLTFDPEESFINNESEIELKKQIKEKLSELEFLILLKYLEGYSYLEISQSVNKPVKSVDNAIQRIRKKILEIK